ncbi:MAG: membrane dipeptidase [Lysobacterales bacterium]|jgi:membrane dipeptidase
MNTNGHEFCADTFIWDDHCGFEMTPDAPIGPLLEPWRDAGIDYFSINVCYDVVDWTRCLENIAALRRRIPMEAPWCRLVSSVAGIDEARAEGRAAATFDIEGMDALNGRLDLVQTYYELGVRHMLFAYNRNNLAGGGCHDEDIGLTDFGRSVIDEMNRVGMVIDCSHTSYKTTMEAMQRSSAPVVFSHSNSLNLADHGRNIRDEQIKACAEGGGVIGINGLNLFLGDGEKSKPETVARHAAYMADLVGAEHVGISLDFDPPIDPKQGENGALEQAIDENPLYWPPEAGYDRPVDFLPLSMLPEVCDELFRLGFTQNEVAGILGGNFRRIAEQVWK